MCYENFGKSSCNKEEVSLFIDNFFEFRSRKNKEIVKQLKDTIVESE